MDEKKVGSRRKPEWAKKVADAHRGSHEHDLRGGFAADNKLAKEAGTKGGEAVKEKYGRDYYREIGKKGGEQGQTRARL